MWGCFGRTGARPRRRPALFARPGLLRPADVAPRRPGPPRLVDDLLAAHRDQQAEQMFRGLQVVLAQRDADEETAEDRLADVRGVEQAPQAGIEQADAR